MKNYAHIHTAEQDVSERIRKPMVATFVLRRMCFFFGWRKSEAWLKKQIHSALARIHHKDVGLHHLWGMRFSFCDEAAAYRFLLRLEKEGKISLPITSSFDDLRAQWEVSINERRV